MENLIGEMYEDFLLSEECSRYYSVAGEDSDCEAQDLLLYIKLQDHILLCKKGALACKDYLKTKNLQKLLLEFRILGLYENIKVINKYICNSCNS